jgi:4-amino-4-deoxy-L-arabinose transferase-like glycosyltransferase
MLSMLRFPRVRVRPRMGKKLLIAPILVVSFLFLYAWHLGTLVPGLSKNEDAARIASGSLHNIVNNPFYAPHKAIQYFFQLLDYHGAFWMRSASVFFVLIFLLSLYFLLRLWFGRFIAGAGTLLFANTPWVIILSRSATPDIMLLSPIFLIFTYVFLSRTTTKVVLAWSLFIFALALSLYTPGMIWFILIILIFGNKRIIKTILKVKGLYAVIGLTILFLLLLPLGYALTRHLSLFKELLGWPQSSFGLADTIQSGIDMGSSLFIKLPHDTDYTIGQFAILNIAQVVLALIGFLSLWNKARRQTLSLLALLIISLKLATLNNNIIFLTLGLPSIAILDAAGLRYLYKKWFFVFPLNPLAKAFAIILVCSILLVHVLYGVRYALLAWPHNVETRKTYVIH